MTHRETPTHKGGTAHSTTVCSPTAFAWRVSRRQNRRSTPNRSAAMLATTKRKSPTAWKGKPAQANPGTAAACNSKTPTGKLPSTESWWEELRQTPRAMAANFANFRRAGGQSNQSIRVLPARRFHRLPPCRRERAHVLLEAGSAPSIPPEPMPGFMLRSRLVFWPMRRPG